MIFNFKTKKSIGNILYTDIHSHILPNLDDGAKSIKESLDMLEALASLGYKRAVVTPHVMKEGYKNSTNKILDSFYLLQNALKESKIDIFLDVSAEYYLDDGFLDLLKADDILKLCREYILFETSYFFNILNFDEIIYEILARGYKPLIAHPERYRYVDDISIYKKWRSMGVLFQVDILSFNGKYGKDALKKAIWLSKRGWIDFLGSDAHNVNDIKSISNSNYRYSIFKVISSNDIKNSRC